MTNTPPAFVGLRRTLAAAIRAHLDRRRPDTPFRATWIREGTPDRPIVIDVPVGAEHRVPLHSYGEPDWSDDRELDAEASRYALGLIALHRGERQLLRYLAGVQSAARREIAAARADGLDVRLVGTDFAPTGSGAVALEEWRDAIDYVLAEISIEQTDQYLRRELTTVTAGDVDEVGSEISRSLEGQAELEARIGHLERLGADLFVDQISIHLIEANGLGALPTLSRLVAERHFEVTLPQGSLLHLSSAGGRAEVSLETPDFRWNGKCLWPRRDIEIHGGPVSPSDITDHPALAGREVVARDGCGARPVLHLEKGPSLLFDAGDLRLWSMPAMAVEARSRAAA